MKRIELRRYTEDDLEDYFKLVNNEEVKQFLPYMYCNNIKVAKAILKRKIEVDINKKRIDAIENIKDKHVIGEIAAVIKDKTAEAEFMINPEYRGKGYSQEAFIALLDIIRSENLSINKIKALVMEENKSSRKMLSKLEFETKQQETGQEYVEYERDI